MIVFQYLQGNIRQENIIRPQRQFYLEIKKIQFLRTICMKKEDMTLQGTRRDSLKLDKNAFSLTKLRFRKNENSRGGSASDEPNKFGGDCKLRFYYVFF